MKFSQTLITSSLMILLLIFAANQAWSQCGPGEHWVDNCTEGQESWQNITMEVFIDMTGDCEADGSMQLTGSALIHHLNPSDDSQNYPGTRPIDGHLDVMDLEIISMDVTGPDGSGVIGAGRGQGNNLAPSLGVMAESAGDPSLVDSFFDVFCEANAYGFYLYNQNPIRVEGTISQLPPFGATYTFTGCLPAYTSPIPGQGVPVGNITYLSMTIGDQAAVPTLSEWGMLLMGLLLLATGTVAVIWRRRGALNRAC